jgi:gliding motility-associated-like protein
MPYYKKFYTMKKSFLLLSLLFGISTIISAQLVIGTNKTPVQLVQQVLVGNGVTVTNITFNGAGVAIAEFSGGGNTNLGLVSGVVLSTGDATDVVGPNSGNVSTNNNTGSDPQLASLITATINDAAVLEFDFTPIADTIRFRYVFGSEEYPEYVSSFNDVFGFFISGPNPAGGNYLNQNIAIVPGTTNTPVSIYNINNGSSNTGPCVNCQYYVNNTGGLTVEFDGMTTVLTAWAVVVPCQSYHMKLAVGDAGDHVLDSGVFLEANSFSTSAVQIIADYTVVGGLNKCVEGCNYAVITAKIPKILTTDYTVKIDTMWGTATNGTDFPFIADSILIPAGQISASITLAPQADGIAEGLEDWNFIFKTSPCTIDTVHIPILDYTPITFTKPLSDTAVCGDSALLDAFPINGWQPYIVNWTPAADIGDPANLHTKAFGTQSGMYYLEVTDSSGCISTDSMYITYNDAISVSFLPDIFNGCEPLTVNFQDMSQPNINKWLWNFGDGASSTVNNPTHTYDAGKYTINLKVESANGCKGEFEIVDLIEAYPKPKAWFEPQPLVTTINDPEIHFSNQTTNGDSWLWDFGDNATGTSENPSHIYQNEGVFTVWLVATSDKGCVDSVMRDVRVIVDEIEVPNIITPNGDGVNDYFVIKNIERVETSTLRIYNRWGKKIYEASPYKNDWNGNGSADGVYFYELDYTTYFREDQASGTVTIISK